MEIPLGPSKLIHFICASIELGYQSDTNEKERAFLMSETLVKLADYSMYPEITLFVEVGAEKFKIYFHHFSTQ